MDIVQPRERVQLPKWNVHFDMSVREDDSRIVVYVAKAHAMASVIRGIPIPPHVQKRLDRLNIVRAVRGTTGIEGTELSEEEVGEVLDSSPETRVLPENRSREEQEVKNADSLMRHVAALLLDNPHDPLTENLIKGFHEIITRGIGYDHNEPGVYRTHQVRAGNYVPPQTGEEVRTLMAGFIEWFNTGQPSQWDQIIRAIVAHFFVISIHPFGDRNGRTSRAVESYLLYQAGINSRGYYSLANYYYRRRQDYVDLLDNVRFRSDPDLTPFVVFGLEGLEEELETVHNEVLNEVRIIAFRDYARETLLVHGMLRTRAGERKSQFLMGLGADTVSLRELRRGDHRLSSFYRDVTPKTLARDLNFLEERDLVVIEGDDLRANLEVMTQFTA